ncbi:MAG: hypothetical protein ACTSQ8_09375, partial [Candidatus Helarchaeota archaeon]
NCSRNMSTGLRNMTKEINELLRQTDHFEKEVPFSDETVERLAKWFTEYELRCCCVPFTKDFNKTCESIEKVLDLVPEAKFSLLYHDPLGESSVAFIETIYVHNIVDAGVSEIFEEIELVAPVKLIKRWDVEKLGECVWRMGMGLDPFHYLKVIIQTPMLNGVEMKMATEICVKNDVEYVKTGTGYFGITLPKHVSWMRDAVDNANKMYKNDGDFQTRLKVAGGIMSYDVACLSFDLGADIIGMSRTSQIIEEIKRRV